MSVYNSAAFLVEAIESVLKQTFSDFEFIIINDGSSDETETIISSFNDNRIVHVNNDGNKGLIYSLNYGISISRSQYIARMDADDICDKTRFEKQIREFENKRVVQEDYFSDFRDLGGFKRPVKIQSFRNGKKILDAELVEVRYFESLPSSDFKP